MKPLKFEISWPLEVFYLDQNKPKNAHINNLSFRKKKEFEIGDWHVMNRLLDRDGDGLVTLEEYIETFKEIKAYEAAEGNK